MPAPQGFSWIEKPLLAALARPDGPEDFAWLRANGIEVLLSLTEDRPRRDWADAANMLVYHEPLEDMEAPSQEQLDRCVSAVLRATERNMGVAVHCGAGLGRTGVVLDVLQATDARVSDAALALGISTGNLITFLNSDPKVWEQANHLRARFGHKALH